MDKAILTCALTGVLTDPRQHPVPVTPEQMAREARAGLDQFGLPPEFRDKLFAYQAAAVKIGGPAM